jgi:hypothetical protein
MNEVASQAGAIANQLAGKDDRYLLIVAVCLLLAGGSLVIRYLIKFLERLQLRQESQSDKLVEVVVTCKSSLDNNTRMLERVSTRFPPIP